MNTQINLRMPLKLLNSVRSYSNEHGFGSVQDFIKETIREKLFDEPEIIFIFFCYVERVYFVFLLSTFLYI